MVKNWYEIAPCLKHDLLLACALLQVLRKMEYVDGNAPLQEKVAYVTQDAQLVVSETVLDVMWFYANLALPRYTPMAHRRQLIEDILFAMDMSHTQVRVPQPSPVSIRRTHPIPPTTQTRNPLEHSRRAAALCSKGDDGTQTTVVHRCRTPAHALKRIKRMTGLVGASWGGRSSPLR